MEGNVTRFDGRVREYNCFRERYDPDVVLPLLREWCGLHHGWRVADIGAGTGMLADVFLTNGNHVVAVEPNAEMRAMCASLHADTPLLEVRKGTAEATELPEASFDMVSVGRAMHWFHPERSMAEFRRILKPGGWVAIIAFGRTETGRKENEALEKVLQTATATKVHTHASYQVYTRLGDFFAGSEFHHTEICGDMQLDWQSLRGMTLSLSHAPLPSSPQFAKFEHALRDYFKRYEAGGAITLETRYWINAGRFSK